MGKFYPAKQSFNPSDLYAVTMLHGGVVIGHVLQIISAACSAFIRRGGVASCEVTGAKYSVDLSQGGMEVPCKLTFTAPSKEIDKLHKLLPRTDFKETSFLTNNLSKPTDTAVTPAIVINPTSTMTTNNVDVKPELSTLDVKPELSKVDVKPEPTDIPSDNEPLKKKS